MDKEEYAELHYLLAKLKYTCAEMINNFNMLELNNMIEKINDIQRILFVELSVDKKDTKIILKGGEDKNESYDKSANDR